jgi:hypothetical protein
MGKSVRDERPWAVEGASRRFGWRRTMRNGAPPVASGGPRKAPRMTIFVELMWFALAKATGPRGCCCKVLNKATVFSWKRPSVCPDGALPGRVPYVREVCALHGPHCRPTGRHPCRAPNMTDPTSCGRHPTPKTLPSFFPISRPAIRNRIDTQLTKPSKKFLRS